ISLLFSIDAVEQVEEIIFSSFPYLLDKYGIARVVPLIEELLPKMKSDVCAVVQSFFADEGYTLEYQPRKTRIDYKRFRKVFDDIFITEGLTLQPQRVNL
ncbi:MAG: hypothetical protein ACE5PV_12560, partial [Candidatus Poribacteria bacterium]